MVCDETQNPYYNSINKKFYNFGDCIFFDFLHLLYIFDYDERIKYVCIKDYEELVKNVYGYDYYFIDEYICIL